MTTDPTKGHTLLPWRVYGRASKTSNFGNWRARICVDPGHSITTIGYCLGGDKDDREVAEANAALIVRAVNAHQALVDALNRVLKGIANEYSQSVVETNWPDAIAALKLARGES